MSRNGTFFISFVEPHQRVPAFWDPYFYRANGASETLGDYVSSNKPVRGKGSIHYSPFRPIEYSDIPKGKYLTFVLEFSEDNLPTREPIVGEEELLMGTMRAYLGNILITPKAEWLNLQSPLFFPVKSEFVRIIPKDGYKYFWWAFLQSSTFLKNLPAGSGGTRPRLHEDALLLTPVKVPDTDHRRLIHQELQGCAEQDWRESMRRMSILNSLSI
ncbi:MAG: hypothetical protein L0229_06830 [Blastocatellia bacterium]|nr:hypothetical protein [Blastocatellia bacterium]